MVCTLQIHVDIFYRKQTLI